MPKDNNDALKAGQSLHGKPSNRLSADGFTKLETQLKKLPTDTTCVDCSDVMVIILA